MSEAVSTDTRTTVGFVGLGQQGAPMAANLVAAGYHLVVRDLDRDRERHFVAQHGGTASNGDPSRLAGVDVVVTMLPNGDVVREALLGDDGLARHLRPGTIVVDTSSSDPYGTRALGAELSSIGLVLVDSPVTRPEAVGEDTRRITFMVGADDQAAIEQVMPLLDTMAARVFRAGPLGAGHAMKTLNNYVSAAALAASLDAMIGAERFGIDVETMLDVFNVGTARNFSTANTLVQQSMSRRYRAGFQLALMVKDLRIARSLFDRIDFDSPLARLVAEQFGSALEAIGDERADLSRAVEDWERRGEVRLPAPRPASTS